MLTLPLSSLAWLKSGPHPPADSPMRTSISQFEIGKWVSAIPTVSHAKANRGSPSHPPAPVYRGIYKPDFAISPIFFPSAVTSCGIGVSRARRDVPSSDLVGFCMFFSG